MINIQSERVFLLSEGPRTLGVEKSYQRLYSYVVYGVSVKDQLGRRQVVYLEKVQLPGGIATSVEAYLRFLNQVNAVSQS